MTWIGSPQGFGTNMASRRSALPRRLEGSEAAAEQWTWQCSEMPHGVEGRHRSTHRKDSSTSRMSLAGRRQLIQRCSGGQLNTGRLSPQ